MNATLSIPTLGEEDIELGLVIKGKAQPAAIQTQLSLFNLPPELWTKIGKAIVDQERPTYDSQSGLLEDPREQPAITRTCKVLRSELLPYFYQTRFAITIIYSRGFLGYSVARERVSTWLEAIGAVNRRNLRNTVMPSTLADVAESDARVRRNWKVELSIGEGVQEALIPTEAGYRRAYGRLMFRYESGHLITFL